MNKNTQQQFNPMCPNNTDIQAAQNHRFNAPNGNVQVKKIALVLRIAVMDDGHVTADMMNLDANVRDHPLWKSFPIK